MKAPSVKPVRCAIYTRVSTEHGLDQEFNSLDAQYEAASAYIKGDYPLQAGSHCHLWFAPPAVHKQGFSPMNIQPAFDIRLSYFSGGRMRSRG
jgi:hypothetical protein